VLLHQLFTRGLRGDAKTNRDSDLCQESWEVKSAETVFQKVTDVRTTHLRSIRPVVSHYI